MRSANGRLGRARQAVSAWRANLSVEQHYPAILFAAGLLLAIALRYQGLDFRTRDYDNFYLPWHQRLSAGGGFAALRDALDGYNPPYMYLLAAVTYLPLGAMFATKLIVVVFDFVIAFFAYRIVKLRYATGHLPKLAALAVLLLPTVVLNASVWGQADAQYVAFIVGGVYFLLRRNSWLACVFFGVAVSFKAQAIFAFPLLVFALFTGYLAWRALLAIPLVYAVLITPMVATSTDPLAVLSIYLGQSNAYPGLLTGWEAPSFWQFALPQAEIGFLRHAAIGLTASMILLLTFFLVTAKVRLNPERILLLGVLSAILVPYFMPLTFSRYWYIADVLSVLLVFYRPARLWVVPILVQVASYLSYQPFLFHTGVDMRIPSAMLFAAMVICLRELLLDLGIIGRREEAPPPPRRPEIERELELELELAELPTPRPAADGTLTKVN